MTRLAGLHAVITGAASGLGAATARRFAAEGAQVVLADIDLDHARATAQAIAAAGGNVLAVRCDITTRADCERLIAEAEAFFASPVDIFHANAGVAFSGALLDATVERIERTIAVNLTGTMLSAQAALRSLVKSPHASLLFTSSLQGLIARGGRSAYTATKHAVTGLMKSLALEFAPMGVRVNAIAPATIDTPLLRTQLSGVTADVDQAIARNTSRMPLGRIPTPEEFAAAALFLVSDEAHCITGHTLVLDSGASAGLYDPPPPR
jgi:NAD(P)-dependent dehydrogenase (short-subunit alcohol dehydrogenase family)